MPQTNLLVLLLVVVLLLAVIPTWPYSRRWGYTPSSLVGVLLIVLLIAWLL